MKWSHEGPKSLCGINLMSLRSKIIWNGPQYKVDGQTIIVKGSFCWGPHSAILGSLWAPKCLRPIGRKLHIPFGWILSELNKAWRKLEALSGWHRRFQNILWLHLLNSNNIEFGHGNALGALRRPPRGSPITQLRRWHFHALTQSMKN